MGSTERAGSARGGYDYVAVGHVTVDVLEDGTRRPGGTAFYSAVQAARLGLRALIVTAGVAGEVERMLEPYDAEFDLLVLPAPATTTLATRGIGMERVQTLLAWAGPIAPLELPPAGIVHLAPVARELARRWPVQGGFVGLTPQGLARGWDAVGDQVMPRAADGDEELAAGCDAIVLGAEERASCAALLEAGLRAGAVVAVTAAAQPTALLRPGAQELSVGVPRAAAVADDLGAGDVFAAAFFTALADGQAPEAATEFAHAAAAVRLSGRGPAAIGTRSEVERMLREMAAGSAGDSS
jgi:ribokinase